MCWGWEAVGWGLEGPAATLWAVPGALGWDWGGGVGLGMRVCATAEPAPPPGWDPREAGLLRRVPWPAGAAAKLEWMTPRGVRASR